MEGISSVGEGLPDTGQIQGFVQVAEPGVEPILDMFSDELKPHWPDKIHDLLARHPTSMAARTADGKGFTVIHGDVSLGNILVPVHGNRPIYIIDRQPSNWNLTIWLAVYDAAYALILSWDTDTRRRFERQILRHYHDRLV